MMPDDYSNTLGGRVQSARKARGLKQRELADLVGVQSMAISELERNVTKDPKITTLDALATALGVTVAWLVRGESDAAQSVTTLDENPEDDEILQAFFATELGQRATEDERRALALIPRRLGRARNVDAYVGLLSALRNGFPKDRIAEAEAQKLERQAKAIAAGRTIVK